MTEHRKRIMAKREAVHAAGPGRATFTGTGKARRMVFIPRRAKPAHSALFDQIMEQAFGRR